MYAINLIFCCISFSFVTMKCPSTQGIAESDTTRVRGRSPDNKQNVTALLDLCYRYVDNNNRLALRFADSACQLARQGNDTVAIVTTGRVKGQLLRVLNHLDESLALLNAIRPIAKRNNYSSEYKRILNALAIGYTYKANYEEALRYHFESLIIREASGNQKEIATTLINIGVLYYKLEDFDRALEYYNRALKLKDEIHDDTDIERLFINIGLCYVHDSIHYEKAATYITKAYKQCSPNCDKIVQMEGSLASGSVFLHMGKLREAEDNFSKSIAIAQELHDDRIQVDNLTSLGTVNRRLHHSKRAIAFLNSAETIAAKGKYNQALLDIYREFFTLYHQGGDFKKASAYEVKYIHLDDSLSKGRLNRLAHVQAQFEEYENRKTIAAQKQILELQQSAIATHRFLNVLIGTVAVLAAITAFVLYRANRQKQRITVMLDQKVRERTRSLNENFVALQRTHEAQLEFLHKASCDLRERLVTLKGLSNLIRADAGSPADLRNDIERLGQSLGVLAESIAKLETKERE
jgi:tetratricopeptide (TPR) repeat protein